MISREQAVEIARNHLEQNPMDSDRFVWKLTDPSPVEGGWLFEYSYERSCEPGDDHLEMFGGAPAFLITHDLDVRDLSWQEMLDVQSQL